MNYLIKLKKCLLFLPRPLVKDIFLTLEYNLNFYQLKKKDNLSVILFSVNNYYPTKINYIYHDLNNICLY
jgi:hypothetical protein